MAQALLQEFATAALNGPAAAGLSVLGDEGLVGSKRIPILVGNVYEQPKADLLAQAAVSLLDYWGVNTPEELQAQDKSRVGSSAGCLMILKGGHGDIVAMRSC